MKLSSDQKSVLVLAIPVAAIAIFARSANFFIFLGIIGIWFWCVRDKKKPQPNAPTSGADVIYRAVSSQQLGAETSAQMSRINSDQKSVLTLATLLFLSVAYGGGIQFALNFPVFVVWIILSAWFYGVRTKAKPAIPPPLPRC